MDKVNRQLHVPVGTGSIDFKPILAKKEKAGVKYLYVEQGNNYVPDVMTCMQKSADYMKRNLL